MLIKIFIVSFKHPIELTSKVHNIKFHIVEPYRLSYCYPNLSKITVLNVYSLFILSFFLKSDSAMSLLLFYQFLSREISSVWIIETEYIHWFSFLFFFLFSCPWGKTNNLLLYSQASIIIVLEKEKNKTYMKAEITVDVSSLVFALWSSHKSLT